MKSMKSIAVIKQIIPTLADIQSAGCFSNPLVSLIKSWTNTLASAACDDLIDLSDAILAFEEIEGAADFEAQQDAIAGTLGILKSMLEDIPAGKMPVYTPPAETRQQVARRLAENLDKVTHSFSISPSRLLQMRSDANSLTNIVRAEVCEGVLPATEDLAAEMTYDAIDNVTELTFGQRGSRLQIASAFAKRMAA